MRAMVGSRRGPYCELWEAHGEVGGKTVVAVLGLDVWGSSTAYSLLVSVSLWGVNVGVRLPVYGGTYGARRGVSSASLYGGRPPFESLGSAGTWQLVRRHCWRAGQARSRQSCWRDGVWCPDRRSTDRGLAPRGLGFELTAKLRSPARGAREWDEQATTLTTWSHHIEL